MSAHDWNRLHVPLEADDQPLRPLATDVPPGHRVAYLTGLQAPRTRARAHAENPHCIECGVVIPTAEEAGLVITPTEGHRVACRATCYVPAIVRFNPTLSAAAARSRANAGGH